MSKARGLGKVLKESVIVVIGEKGTNLRHVVYEPL
jgi:hypothetical protein